MASRSGADAMSGERIFIFGAGYSARTFARQVAAGAASIHGTTRSTERFEALAADAVVPLVYGGDGFGEPLLPPLRAATHLLVSLAPGEAGDPVLDDLARARLEMPALRWIGYLSTVGVYGDHGGAWVDEETVCRPSSDRSRWRLAAEQGWTSLAERLGVPIAILRLSGIYGPGRNAFVNLEKGTARRVVKPGQVFNRVHVEDVAGAARHLMGAGAGGIYNVTDDEPAPPQDVVTYAAELMGIEPPPPIPFDEAGMGPMARSFYSECKRVSNAKLKSAGYVLRFPNYRIALESLWSARQ